MEPIPAPSLVCPEQSPHPPQTSMWLPKPPRPASVVQSDRKTAGLGGSSKCQLLFLLLFLQWVSWTKITLSLQLTFDGPGRGCLSPTGGFSLLSPRLPGHPQHRGQCHGHATGWSSGRWGGGGIGASASPQRASQSTCPADNQPGACLHQREGAFPLLRAAGRCGSVSVSL